MAATDATWGSIVGGYGRIGIAFILKAETVTTQKYTIEVYFKSKYSVEDGNNRIYFNIATSSGEATTLVGAKKIIHLSETGEGWQQTTLIYSTDVEYERKKNSYGYFVNAKFDQVDRVGGAMTYTRFLTISPIPSYTIAFDANGGTGAPSALIKYATENVTIPLTKPTRTGYAFVNWRIGNTTYNPGDTFTTNANTSLSAAWTPLTYTVSFNANGGTGAPSAQTKTYGVELTLSSTKPTREGYIFKGWGTSASSTTAAYFPAMLYKENRPAVLYAIWAVDYVKPRITNLSVTRCDSTGAETDEGTYALVQFAWNCDKTISEIKIEWEASDVAATSEAVAASGTSGNVSKVVGAEALTTEKSYSFSIYVADTNGYSYAFTTLPGSLYPIDVKNGGKGVSIGKPAELDNVFDVAFQTKFTGGILNEVFEKYDDLNRATTPNTYVSVNQGASYYSNCPITSGTFVLEVMRAGAEGQLYQRLTTTFKDGAHQVFERHFYQNTWGNWVKTYSDTGWLDLTLQSGISVGTEMGYLKGRLKNGVLYIKGDVIGINANWKYFALVPEVLREGLASSNRFVGLYNLSYLCGLNLQSGGQLYVTTNSTASWDASANVSINIAIGI